MTNNTFITFTVTGDLTGLKRFREAFEREWNAFKKYDGDTVTFNTNFDDRFTSPSMLSLVRQSMAPPSVGEIQEILGPAHRDIYIGAPTGMARRERVDAVKQLLFDYTRDKAVQATSKALGRPNLQKMVAKRLNLYRPGENAFMDLAMNSHRRGRR